MPWILEESDDCGVHWHRADLTQCYFHPRVALLEALEIIQDEWRPPEHALRQLTHALEVESVAYFWHRAIRVVRVDLAARSPVAGPHRP
ncbi:MAG TPA: hypothetical protein VFU43_29560 [Streptosporangiaceae bacterium]|nr:hypothetical protein [Streptosporangiaceae bacterium]